MTDGALAAVHIYFAGITGHFSVAGTSSTSSAFGSAFGEAKAREPIGYGLNAGQIALELRQFLDGQRCQLALLILRCEYGLQLDG